MAFLGSSRDRRWFVVLCCVGIIGVLCSIWFGWFAMAVTAFFAGAMIAVVLLWNRSRHREIEELTDYLEQVLYDDTVLLDMGNEEGELNILRSDIYKMTIRLREQADALERDKRYLADSMADISHQLRTPLTSMHLALSLLSREETTQEQRYDLLRELSLLVSRMDTLISALLKISKIDAGTASFRSETVLVRQVVEEAAEVLAIPMELRGQTLSISIAPEVSFVGDPMWTAEALENILKNGMEHMDEGGTITVSATENGLLTEIVITDDGKGIAPEDLPHIFERFYRGKNDNSGGFGIGLSLSRMIITRQNGTIKVQNRKGGGTRFVIRFYKGVV